MENESTTGMVTESSNGMITGLLHLHSSLRYVIVILLLAAIFGALQGVLGKKKFTPGFRKIGLFAMVSTHIQLVLGIVLYFLKDYNTLLSTGAYKVSEQIRFFAIEHLAGMLLAIILITLGYSLTKRAKTDAAKYKRTLILYSLGFLVMFFSIPWPFLKSFGTWYVQ